MGAFEDFVNVELPLRVSVAASPGAVRYPRFTGVGKAVEARTAAEFLGDIGALAATGLTEWDEQAGDPSTPASTKWKLFFKTGGLYHIDDGGAVTGPLGSGGGAVDSVFTRTGAVVAAASDYDASQVDNDSGVAGTFVSNALDNLAGAIIGLAHSDLSLDDGANPHGTTISDVGAGTLAEINAIISDATLVDVGHTHTESDITDLGTYLANVVEDTSPELGAALDCKTYGLTALGSLASTSSIPIKPDSASALYMEFAFSAIPKLRIYGTAFAAVESDDSALVSWGVQEDDSHFFDMRYDKTDDGGLLACGGPIDFRPSSDDDDFIRLTTSAGVPQIGTSGDCNLRITPDGGLLELGTDVQFDADIFDANGLAIIKLAEASSAVNQLTIGNAATGNAVTLLATGVDTDINLEIDSAGAGSVVVGHEADITLGVLAQGTTRAIYPRTSGKWDLGSSSYLFNDLFCSGGTVRFPNLPTSDVGLTAGDLWNDSGTVKVKP